MDPLPAVVVRTSDPAPLVESQEDGSFVLTFEDVGVAVLLDADQLHGLVRNALGSQLTSEKDLEETE